MLINLKKRKKRKNSYQNNKFFPLVYRENHNFYTKFEKRAVACPKKMC